MFTIAVSGIKGGVGSTTVCAHIAAGIAQRGHAVLALDMSAANHLGLFFGLAWQESQGLAPLIAQQQDWSDGSFQSPQGVYFVPYGNTNDSPLAEPLFQLYPLGLDGFLEQSAQLLRHHAPRKNHFLILDLPFNTPLLDKLWQITAIEQIQCWLKVLNIDPLCYSTLNQQGFEQQGIIAHKLLINRYCPAINLDRDIHALIQSQWRQHLAPVKIHLDQHIGDALANKQTVFDYAQESLAKQDFALLSSWLIAQQEHKEKHQVKGNA